MSHLLQRLTAISAVKIGAIVVAISLCAGVALADPYMATGTYTGDGALNRAITGIGITPDLVIIKGVHKNHSVARTSDMPPGMSKALGFWQVLEPDSILSLDSDGFSIGFEARVNEAGIEYHWVAMKAGTDIMAIGEYTGNDAGFRSINGLGFRPAAVIVIPDLNESSLLRTDSMAVALSTPLHDGAGVTNGIVSLSADGFNVSSGWAVNKSSTTYYYIAWPEAAGAITTGGYLGDGSANRTITGLGRSAEYMLISDEASEHAVQRMSSVTGDASLFFANQNVTAGAIKSINSDGFVVGANTTVNSSGTDYNWIAFSNPTAERDLELTKTVDDPGPIEGATVVYTVSLTNNDASQATGVAVSDTLPTGVTYDSAVASAGSFNPVTGLWAIGTVAAGATVTLDITATVDAGTAGTAITNDAQVSASDQTDLVSGNNSDAAIINVPGAILSTEPYIATGTYTGNLTTNRAITGIGFSPDLVIIKGLAIEKAVLTTSNMPAGMYNPVGEPLGLQSGEILSLDADGFTIDASVWINDNSVEYYWVAMKAVPGRMVLGQYTGDGIDDRLISGVGAKPAAVLVMSDSIRRAQMRSDAMAVDTSTTLNSLTPMTNGIKACEADGFTIGTDGAVNEVGTTYYYVAWPGATDVISTGTYVGDDAINRSISAVGYQPEYVMVIGMDAIDSVHRTSLMPDDTTLFYVKKTTRAGSIRSFNPTGFNVGADPTVNTLGSDYNWIAFANPSAAEDLGLTKTVDDPVPVEGATVVYTVSVTNNDADPATNVAVTDTLPTGVTYDSSVASTGSFNPITGLWTIATVAAGATVTLDITATVDAGTAGDAITNVAQISASDQADAVSGNNSDNAIITVGAADLVLTMGADTANPNVGQTVILDVTLLNDGPLEALGAQVSLPIPAGLLYQSDTPDQGTYNSGTGIWTVGTLSQGDNPQLFITCTVAPGVGGTDITVSGNASLASPTESDTMNNAAEVTLSIPAANLALISLVNNATPNVGETVVYTAVLTNTGPDDATGMTISAVLPVGIEYLSSAVGAGSYDNPTEIWTLATLSAGSSTTLTLIGSPIAGTGGSTLTTSFAITGADQEDSQAGNNTSSVNVTVSSSDLSLTKIVDVPSPNEGANVTFHMELTNLGPNHATGVDVRDLLPSGLDFVSAVAGAGSYDEPTGLWTVGTVNNGATVVLDLVAQVKAGTAGSTLTNTASVFAVDQEDPVTGNNSDSAAVTVNSTDLSLTKNVDEVSPNVGDSVVYTLDLTNEGLNPATGVAVTDSLPSGVTFVSAATADGTYDENTGLWTVGTVAGGATVSLAITVSVDNGTIGDTITNEARISASDLADPVGSNNSDDASITVASTDLRITKIVDNASPNEGDTVTYTVTVTNTGVFLAGGIEVTDQLPAGVTFAGASASSGSYSAGTDKWTLGLLGGSASATLSLTATIDGGTSGNVITNTATITASGLGDPDSANNTSSAVLTVSSTDLEVTKTVDLPTPSVGEKVTFTITTSNLGPNTATGIVVHDILPGGLSLESFTPSQGNYNPVDGLWTLGTLAATANATLGVTAIVDASAAGKTIVNTAAINAVDQVDPDEVNNTDTASIDVPGVVTTPTVTVRALDGGPVTVLPGAAPKTVLHLELVNRGSEPDTLRSVTLTNLTVGADAPNQAALDAEWGPVTLFSQLRGSFGINSELSRAPVDFTGGTMTIDGFAWVINPGDTLSVRVNGSASLQARDSATLQLGVNTADDIDVRQTVIVNGSLPLRGGDDLIVDGFAAAQGTVQNIASGTLPVGTLRRLALAVDLPSNGYRPDDLYGLTLVNRGTAGDGTDIAAMEAWADDGDGIFDVDLDPLLGSIVNSGELWQLTGLGATVPVGGRRFYVTVDVAADAIPGRTIQLELPTEHGDAVIMASGNDGPRDLPLINSGVLAIAVVDRLVLTTESINAGIAYPGDRDVTLLTVNLANTYTEEKLLETLVITNATVGDPGATIAELDATIEQVFLRLDGDGDGILGDFLTDPTLGSGSFSGGVVSFTGLNLPVPAGDLVRVFVSGDVSLTGAAEGDVLAASLESAVDVWSPKSALVADWPLNSGAAWQVDGMVAAQIISNSVPGRTLGPDDGPELALDVIVPANGYMTDRLVGLSLTNEGTAVPADLAQVRLWADDGDGVFDSITDLELGGMAWFNGRWISPILSYDVPLAGSRLFVSIDAASAPTDSATISFGIPINSIVMASENSGPLDVVVPPNGTLVLSTSALISQVEFDAVATTVGQTGTVRMLVRNTGSESVSGITPTLITGAGPGTLTLDAVAPATMDLPVAGSAEFVWTFTADAPGNVSLVGSAEGTGDVTFLAHASAPSPSNSHHIYTPVPRLDTYPTAGLPASVPRGQTQLVPLTLTLANPGDSDVGVAHLDSLVVRLAETSSGPAIVPADLVARVVLSEGNIIYVDETSLATTGDEIVLRLTPAARITGSEPITLSLRIDLMASSTAPSFLMAIDGASSFFATDVVSGLPVPVALGSGTFPILTQQAELVSPSGDLEVTTVLDLDRAAQPGQTAVNLTAIAVRNDTTDPTASPIRIQSLGFVPRDVDGNAIPLPSDFFDAIRVDSPLQTLFSGQPQYTDSLVVMVLATPLEVPFGTSIDLDFTADLALTAPLGAVRFDFGDQGQWLAEDTGDGTSVGVTVLPMSPNTGLQIQAPVAQLNASGEGLLPPTAGLGARNLRALSLTLIHPGSGDTSSATWDSLTLNLRDAQREPLNPAGLLDRVRLVSDGLTIGLSIDPVGADGAFTIGLTSGSLAPGDTLDVTVEVDVRADAPFAEFELVADLMGFFVRDSVSGAATELNPTGVWPVWSGLTTIVVPADEIQVAGNSLMPALLAPSDDTTPVLHLTLTNPASPGAGPVEITALTLLPSLTDNDFPQPGTAVAVLAAEADGIEIGRNDTITNNATELTVTLSPSLMLAAGASIELELMVGVRNAAPAGRLRLSLAESGLIVGVPGSPPGGIRIVAAAGQVLPLETAVGNVGSASLADSYINFPNPFAAGQEATTFAYFLRDAATVSLRLLTPYGEGVATLMTEEDRPAGLHQTDTWAGDNGRGLTVRNGVYLAELVVTYADGTRERVLRKVAVVR